MTFARLDLGDAGVRKQISAFFLLGDVQRDVPPLPVDFFNDVVNGVRRQRYAFFFLDPSLS